QCV
ncbi:carbon starvation CstA family protein, partial [Vibrio parahaemolyticus V-223/04]